MFQCCSTKLTKMEIFFLIGLTNTSIVTFLLVLVHEWFMQSDKWFFVSDVVLYVVWVLSTILLIFATVLVSSFVLMTNCTNISIHKIDRR